MEKADHRGVSPGLSGTKVFLPLILLWIASGLWPHPPAGAAVYDDFNQTGTDGGKWTVSYQGSPYTGLFTQPGSATGDGRLHFDPVVGVAATGTGKLISKVPFGPGFFSLEFYNFSSTNLQPPGSHEGAFIGIGLTDGTNWVRVIRDQNGDTNGHPLGVFEVNYNIGNDIQVHYVDTAVSQGKLGLKYDGTKVTFYYDDGSGWRSTGWKTSGQPGEWGGEWMPGWRSRPKVYIQGYDLFGKTSVRLDNLVFTPLVFLYLPLIRNQL
jgi:hypothetical protein